MVLGFFMPESFAVDKGAEEGILLQLLHNDRYNQGRAVHAAKNENYCGDDRQRRH